MTTRNFEYSNECFTSQRVQEKIANKRMFVVAESTQQNATSFPGMALERVVGIVTELKVLKNKMIAITFNWADVPLAKIYQTADTKFEIRPVATGKVAGKKVDPESYNLLDFKIALRPM
jgi:hypothetical protein